MGLCRGMIIGTFSKTAAEIKQVNIDVTALASNATISLISVTATDSRGADVTSSVISSSPAPALTNTTVAFFVQDGAPGPLLPPYYISTKIQSATVQEQEESAYEETELVLVMGISSH